MALSDYPIDLRADYPEHSSRGWAALTILLIKFLALIPHFVILVFLGIAQVVVAIVAQVVVAIKGEYPPGMFDFVSGVLRWSTRVSAFVFSLTDRYPPFTLQPDDSYPVDVVIERPAQSSRVYALFTIIVEILFAAGMVALVIFLIHRASGTSFQTNSGSNFSTPSYGSSGLLLRQIAALPHYIVLVFLGLGAFIVWVIVQWVILFTAAYPRGMFDFVTGFVRWQTRVNGYALGLIDRYPPFTFDPSVAAPALAAPAIATAATTAPAITPPALAPAAWYPDPAGRHTHRYWDGTQWTAHVADDGRAGLDPLAGPGSPTQS